MLNEMITEQQRKKLLIKILLECGKHKFCKGCGCRLPGKQCSMKDELNSEDLQGMKAILKRMQGKGARAL